MRNYDRARKAQKRYSDKLKTARHAHAKPCAAQVDGRPCKRWGKMKIEGKWLCLGHRPKEWKIHDKIVARIRAIPDRA